MSLPVFEFCRERWQRARRICSSYLCCLLSSVWTRSSLCSAPSPAAWAPRWTCCARGACRACACAATWSRSARACGAPARARPPHSHHPHWHRPYLSAQYPNTGSTITSPAKTGHRTGTETLESLTESSWDPSWSCNWTLVFNPHRINCEPTARVVRLERVQCRSYGHGAGLGRDSAPTYPHGAGKYRLYFINHWLVITRVNNERLFRVDS